MLRGRKLNDILSDKRFIRAAIFSALGAVVLIVLSSYIHFGSDERAVDAERYTAQLREQLLGIVSHIDGVGEAEIFLTMDNAGENVYMTNSDTKTKSIEPTVRGVVIVCSGGDDPVVIQRVLAAVTRSLSISSDKVCITKLAENILITEE